MSLLDDVSIVVTPNGYKAGELYAVIPVPTLGTEELTCGNFECAVPTDYWNNGEWVISGGVATLTAATGTAYISQGIGLDAAKTYEVTVDVIALSGTPLYIRHGAITSAPWSTLGVHTEYITGSSGTFYIRANSGGSATIDNISVKEVLVASADMDVTRATAATRVDEDGLVNYAEVIGGELVTDGEFPSNTNWNESNAACEIIGGKAVWTSAPNSTGFTGINLNNAICEIGKTYKITYTIDSITEGGLRIRFPDFGTQFNSSGTYPLTVTNTLTATSTNIYFQGLGTTTASISNVSVKEVDRDNVPRIDYTGGGCPHILAEPQRTNLVLNSEPTTNEGAAANITYESFSWAIGFDNCVVFGDNSVARYWYGSSVTSGTEYTLSAYILMDDNSEPVVSNDISSGDFSLNIGNAIGGGTINASVSMGNNIWRVSKTKVSTQTTSNNGVLKYTTQSSKGFKVVGYQMEVGSYPTSYIPTTGSTVTRNQDIFTRDGIGSLINSTEGVLFIEMARQEGDTSAGIISLNNGTASQTVALYYFSTGTIYFDIISSSPTVSGGVGGFNTYNFNKIALKYKSGDIALWVNGVEVLTRTNAISLTGLNKISFDYGSGALPFFGKVKQLQVYNTALTDAQLTSLTT